MQKCAKFACADTLNWGHRDKIDQSHWKWKHFMFENSVLLYAKYFVSGCLRQLLISKLEKKNLSAAEKDMIVKVQYKLCSY